MAGSAAVAEQLVVTGLIEARLPRANARGSANELLRRLVLAGDGAEEVLAEGAFGHNTGLLLVRGDDVRVLDRDGRAHPRWFALDAHTSGRSVAAFARPRTNAPSFRRNDKVARELLRFLATSRSGWCRFRGQQNLVAGLMILCRGVIADQRFATPLS
ncbi:hypothetical protein [Crossiella sp. NPDC003009]